MSSLFQLGSAARHGVAFSVVMAALAGTTLWFGSQLLLAQEPDERRAEAPRIYPGAPQGDRRPDRPAPPARPRTAAEEFMLRYPHGETFYFYGETAPSGPHRNAAAENENMRAGIGVLQSEDASASQKDEARKQIEGILSEQFDRDLEHREKQIEDLQRQIEKLKEQLEKRREAKERLVELRIELLINEAEGLGFPNAWNSGPVFGRGPMMPGAMGPGMSAPAIQGLPRPNIPAEPRPPARGEPQPPPSRPEPS